MKIRRFPLFGLWSRLLRFPARFAGTTATEYAPLPKGLEPGALLDGFRERCAAGQSLLIVKDVPEVSPLLGAGDNEAAMRLARIAPDKGFIVVEGQALAYVPIDFSSTDEYLSRLSKSRRKNLRRKLKSRERLDIEAVPLGDARFGSLDVLEELYGLYLGVYAQSEIHFDLLTRDFFAGLLQSREIGGVVFCYRHDGELVGYNICLEHGGMLIDKYIGLRYPQARELDLYFVSWFVNLEHALERGLRFYVAGWTDPEVKAGLGARFTFTRHLVWVRNPILRRILYMFRRLGPACGGGRTPHPAGLVAGGHTLRLHAPGVQCAGSPSGRRVACGLRLCVHGQRRFPPRHADPAAPPVPPPAARVP